MRNRIARIAFLIGLGMLYVIIERSFNNHIQIEPEVLPKPIRIEWELPEPEPRLTNV